MENELRQVNLKNSKSIQKLKNEKLATDNAFNGISEKYKKLADTHDTLKKTLAEVRISKTKEVERMEKALVDLREQLDTANSKKKSAESAKQCRERSFISTKNLKIELD